MALPADAQIPVMARQAVLEEISFRTEKLWRIFSWASTLLVALTGGIVALRTGTKAIPLPFQIVLAGVAVVLAAYTIFWLRQNLELERFARDALAKHDDEMQIALYNSRIGGQLPRPDAPKWLGYQLTVGLLAGAAGCVGGGRAAVGIQIDSAVCGASSGVKLPDLAWGTGPVRCSTNLRRSASLGGPGCCPHLV